MFRVGRSGSEGFKTDVRYCRICSDILSELGETNRRVVNVKLVWLQSRRLRYKPFATFAEFVLQPRFFDQFK